MANFNRKNSAATAATTAPKTESKVYEKKFSKPFNGRVGRIFNAEYLGVKVNPYTKEDGTIELPTNAGGYAVCKGGDAFNAYINNVAKALNTIPFAAGTEVKTFWATKGKDGDKICHPENLQEFITYIDGLSDEDYEEFLKAKKDRKNATLKANYQNIGLLNVTVGDLSVYSCGIAVRVNENGDLVASVSGPQEKVVGADGTTNYYPQVSFTKEAAEAINAKATELVNELLNPAE